MTAAKEWGLYVHWPFCLSKCPYCDFNSHVRARIDEERWGKALVKELMTPMAGQPEGRLVSIFFGGGTPSLMPTSWVKEIIQTARSLGPTAPDLEVTLEANPTSSELTRFEAFAQAGVNRLSLGIQAFEETSLAFLGRTHSGAQAHQAIEMASQIFERFSFDLIYALPGQTGHKWQRTLEEALLFQPRHLSCYQLTYEPGTAFYPRFLRGELSYPEEKEAIALHTITEEVLSQAELQSYEVSNYAAPGAECRHNLLYWRYQDYRGIGAGAHGRVWSDGKKVAYQNLKAPETWLEAVETTGTGYQEALSLTPFAMFQEWLLMGLRLREGLDTSLCESLTGEPWEKWVPEATLKPLIKGGFMTFCQDILHLSLRGRLVLNQIAQILGKERKLGP